MKPRPKAPTPVLSMNGTGGAELIAQKANARHVILIALRAMKDAAPHGRDYCGKPDDYQKAIDTHRARVVALMEMAEELEAEAIAIQEAY